MSVQVAHDEVGVDFLVFFAKGRIIQPDMCKKNFRCVVAGIFPESVHAPQKAMVGMFFSHEFVPNFVFIAGNHNRNGSLFIARHKSQRALLRIRFGFF